MFLSEEMKESDAATTRVKEIYAVYRVWSDERGERPMTQIAFHRKLSDRGLQIIGQGSRAEIKNYIMAPRSVESNEINWELATRLAR
jgi:phage/plasmid-associated DNA primase